MEFLAGFLTGMGICLITYQYHLWHKKTYRLRGSKNDKNKETIKHTGKTPRA